MNKKIFLMTLTLSSALYVNAISSQSAEQNAAYTQNSQADQQDAEDLLLKLIQIEMTYQSYLQAQDTGENTREFTNSFDSHFKVLTHKIESMNSATSDEKALENLDMFFKKFDSLYASIGNTQDLRGYFKAPFNSVNHLKSKIDIQILQNNFKRCYVKSEIPNRSENGSPMIEILNALSEYKCYVNTYRSIDFSIRESYKDKINEYFGIVKQKEYRATTHYSPRKNKDISVFKKRGIATHTKRHKFVSQNYIAENDIFSQYVLGNTDELKHLNTPNGLGQNAIELAISLNLDNVAQILTEALSDFTQTLENGNASQQQSAKDIEQKIQNLPASYKTALTRDEIISVIQENPNSSDSVLYNKMYAKMQENSKENIQSGRMSENIAKETLPSSEKYKKIIPSASLADEKPMNSVLPRGTLQARH